MGRDICQVIDKILKLVPEGHSIIERLNYIKKTASYRPPELMYEMWELGSHYLATEIGDPIHAWEFQVADIWNGVA